MPMTEGIDGRSRTESRTTRPAVVTRPISPLVVAGAELTMTSCAARATSASGSNVETEQRARSPVLDMRTMQGSS